MILEQHVPLLLQRALNHARGTASLNEYAYDAEDRALSRKYGDGYEP